MLALMRAPPHPVDRARPPPVVVPGGGGGGGWALLLTAGGLIEAQLVRGLLEASGVVPVHLDAHDPSPGAWLFLSGNVNAPVRVFVPRSQLDQARLALLEGGFGIPDDDPVTAVRAGTRGERARWVRVLWIVIAVAIASAFALRLLAAACIAEPC